MQANEAISFVGCGWLGFSLAKKCVQEGLQVKVSTTSIDKLNRLQEHQMQAFHFCAGLDFHQKDAQQLFEADHLVISLPFRRTFSDPRIYLDQIRQVVDCSQKQTYQKVFFTSSTSVYPKHYKEAQEELIFQPDTNRSRVLLEVEAAIRSISSEKYYILRLAGLYGPEREIGKFIKTTQMKGNGLDPVNLVHQDDCVQIFWQFLCQKVDSGIYNICSDQHPLRHEIYGKVAQKYNHSAISFEKNSEKDRSKVVLNQKVKKVLGYTFLHPDPMQDVFGDMKSD